MIDALFEVCGPEQRWRLQQKLPELLFRDFLKDFPAELFDKVLRYLDGPNLINCLKVSKVWNERISGTVNIWRVISIIYQFKYGLKGNTGIVPNIVVFRS